MSAIIALGTLGFLLGPILLIVWVSFTPEMDMSVGFTNPSLRWYRELFRTPEFFESFRQSLYLAGGTTAVSLVVGTPAAYAIGRFRFPGRDAINTILLSPLIIPGVAVGLSLAQFLSRMGVSRGYLALLVGHVVVTVPYVIRTVGASLVGVDRSLELAAQDLGASRLRAAWSVTLPLLRPGIMTGALFTFIISFDELTTSLFLTGVRVVPLPVRIYTYVETVIEPTAAAVCALLVLFSLGFILLVEWLAGLQRVLGGVKEFRDL